MTTAELTPQAPAVERRKPTASIVIPVHNKATITRQCLDALLAEPEDGVDRQLVVVDDGSNDTTPTSGWLSALVHYAARNPAAAVVGAKLLFPNDTIQHAGVAIGLDSRPHHIYAGFPGDHP